MDFTTALKFAHVLAAVLWVGGGFTTILAGILLARRATAQNQLVILQAVTLLAPRLFIPASVFTLASGVTLLFAAGWGWQPFTTLGLAGVLFTVSFGAVVLGPSCERALKLADTHGAESAIPSLRRVQRLAMMDYSVQFAIVFLMVVKPGWQDVSVFTGLAIVIALAAAAALRPMPRLA